MFNAELIKKVVYASIPKEEIEQIIVFGSRAKNQENADSDTDIYVLMNKKFDWGKKIRYQNNIGKAFVFDYQQAVDVIVNSSERYDKYQKIVGSLEYHVKKDGVAI